MFCSLQMKQVKKFVAIMINEILTHFTNEDELKLLLSTNTLIRGSDIYIIFFCY